MSIHLPPVIEQRRAELNAAILILKGLLADPASLHGLENEGEARNLLVGRLEALEQALQSLVGDVTNHYHSTDRDLQWATGKLPMANNSDLVLNHINNVVVNPHNITYAILGADLSGLTLTNAGIAVNPSDIPTLGQLQSLIAAAVADVDLSGIDLSGYEPAFPKNTAFNKNFGLSADTVAEGNHGHEGVYEPANSSILAHIEATSNPHGVSIEQIGAASIIHNHDGVYEPASENLQLHIISNTNPHSVTAAQIGAALENHDHGDIYEPANDNIQQHIASTENPHSITAAQIGAADMFHLHDGIYEPVIGSKGTAFNKNFGTSAGTVAEGDHAHECLLVPSTVIYVDGNLGDEYLEYFEYEYSGGMEYWSDCPEAGTEVYPFKTLFAAVHAAPINSIIKIKPGVHYTDDVILPYGVSLEGYGSGQVVLSGRVETGAGKFSLRNIEFRGELIINGDCSITECLCKNKVSIIGDGIYNVNLLKTEIVGDLNDAVLFVDIPGRLVADMSNFVQLGDGAVIEQHRANITMHGSLVKGNTSGALWAPQSGIVNLFNSRLINDLGGGALSLVDTDELQDSNLLFGVVASGDILCGDRATVVDGIYQPAGTLLGSNIIKRPASMIANDSSVAGATVKAALETLANSSGNDYSDADARFACVAQTITNGVTTSAPSQDVVYDALALKVAANPAISAGTSTKVTYDEKGLIVSGGNLSAGDIPLLHADKIGDGVLNIARIPAAAIERLVPVANEAARFALDSGTVQLGDTVKEMDTGLVYIVVDENNLSNSNGYAEYAVGMAASVPWSGVTDKPAEFPPAVHVHSEYALVEDVGDIANNPISSLSTETPESFATNTGSVEARHFAPADVDIVSDFETTLNLKSGTTIQEVFLFLRDGDKNVGRIDLAPVVGNTYNVNPAVALSSKNSEPKLGDPEVITNNFSSNVQITGNMPAYTGIRITITHTGDLYSMPIVIKDDQDNTVVSSTMFYDMYSGFSYSYSNGGNTLNIQINDFFGPSSTGVAYEATIDCQLVDAPDRYFIGVRIDGVIHYILGDGADYVGFSLDSNNAILPGMTLGSLADTIVQDKNLVNLLGTSLYDTSFYNDKQTVYDVFTDIKDKLVDRPTLSVVNSMIGMNGDIQLVPEFGNCVFSALGFAPDTLGVMTTEHDAVANQNHYKWVSAETVAQSYGIVTFVELPHRFGVWNDIVINAKTEGAATVMCRLYDSSGALLVSHSISSSGAWVTSSLSVGQLAALNAGDWTGKQFKVVFEVASLNNEAAYVGHISLGYDKA